MESLFNDNVFRGKSSASTNNRLSNSKIVEAGVKQSGNSDVDVNVFVEVDVIPIALAFLCLSLVKKEISNEEFEFAAKKLLDQTDKYRETKKRRNSNVKYFNENIWRR
ncbi:hypothetical protein [Fredinandcohnia onubensis]|uniref:hypothetical protein n=1 Tax=Fredinandcohnia onubensis TaxID=1571209 RepID=UPI000C0BFA93|nr:hypothetical protein [Fredinandcohnia onubensis]